MRKASIKRQTSETGIELDLVLDAGEEQTSRIQTGLGMLDHMLGLWSHWSGTSLVVNCQGDLQVDAHHSVEDVGICLGQALEKALGDKKGINRVGWAKVPLDEALTECVVDLSGRPYFVYSGDYLLPRVIVQEEKDIWREFFKSLAFNAKMNLHLTYEHGQNGHHLLESGFKSLGLAMRQAMFVGRADLLSTKGALD